MFKKIIIGLVVLGVIVLAGWKLFFSGGDVSTTIEKKRDELTAYHMEATMDIEQGENVKNYLVKTDYQKLEENENFKVSLTDTNINQEQIIIKNAEGVYVLTPTLNQVYKFKSEWPTNSPKPYLYHAILSSFDGKHEIKKVDDGIIVTTNPNYTNNPTWVKQDVKLTNDLSPKYVNIYNAKNEAIVKINFTTVDFSPKFEDGYFDVKLTMQEARSTMSETTSSIEKDFPLYPTGANVAATKKEEITSNIGGAEVVIMVYEGTDSFTVVQQLLDSNEELVISEVDGELESVFSGVAYSKNNYLIYIEDNIKYQIYSKDLSTAKKLEVAQGMEYNIIK
ncbi:MAG: hypothetical protein J1F31_03560 [Erysipelotrichales bacterium]|nr:hypothetical protein [Erysipelotrichales bacterium]